MQKINRIGQQFGTRLVIKNECNDDDWISRNLKIPKRKEDYVLTKCLNCGSVFPSNIKIIRRDYPKRCFYCSNIGNKSNVQVLTNTWATYDDYAVCNVLYGNEVVSFYIDADRYEEVSKYQWRIAKKRNKYYVITGSYRRGTAMYLHQMIFGKVEEGKEIDHIDGNSLNNRIQNLREVTHSENCDNVMATRIDNQIGIRGVSYSTKDRKYRVDCHYHNRRFYMKPWKNLIDAVWCRYFFEEYFDLVPIKSNPLFQMYQDMPTERKEAIREYTYSVINNTQK